MIALLCFAEWILCVTVLMFPKVYIMKENFVEELENVSKFN